MKVTELLKSLFSLSETYKINPPYIVGGVPRDIAFGMSKEIKDLDITTGNKDSINLAVAAYKQWPTADFRVYDDGHSSLDFANIRVDFSNNFQIPNIEKILEKKGIKNPSNLEKEVYSRDFTINTLLQPMDLNEKALDITGLGLNDIENKILRTPIDANLTIGHDARRILRALKLSMKFDLKMSDDLKDAILKYHKGVEDLPLGSVKKQINQMLKIDSKKTINLLSEFDLLPIIPLSKMMNEELVKNKMIQQLLED